MFHENGHQEALHPLQGGCGLARSVQETLSHNPQSRETLSSSPQCILCVLDLHLGHPQMKTKTKQTRFLFYLKSRSTALREEGTESEVLCSKRFAQLLGVVKTLKGDHILGRNSDSSLAVNRHPQREEG